MADAISTFFDNLNAPDHAPLLKRVKGTVQLDLGGDGSESWFVTVDRGTVSVSRTPSPTTCVVHGDKRQFERLLRGEGNAMTTFLRGELTFEGDPSVLLALQRVFPGGSREQ